jgi:hypothetical protein
MVVDWLWRFPKPRYRVTVCTGLREGDAGAWCLVLGRGA